MEGTQPFESAGPWLQTLARPLASCIAPNVGKRRHGAYLGGWLHGEQCAIVVNGSGSQVVLLLPLSGSAIICSVSPDKLFNPLGLDCFILPSRANNGNSPGRAGVG